MDDDLDFGNLGYSTMYRITDVPSNFSRLKVGSCFGEFFSTPGTVVNTREAGIPELDKSVFRTASGSYRYVDHAEQWQLALADPVFRNRLKMEGELILYVRLGKACTRHQADLFLDEFVLPNIPVRLSESFTIHHLGGREFDVHWQEYVDEAIKGWELGRGTDTPYPAAHLDKLNKKKGEPWKKIVFDLSKVGPSDLFTMLTLFRYPQEFSSIISYMQLLQQNYKMDVGLAFLNAHLSNCPFRTWDGLTQRSNHAIQTGHSFPCYTVINNLCKGQVFLFDNYSPVNYWPDTWASEESVGSGNRVKKSVQDAFSHPLIKQMYTPTVDERIAA